MEKTLTGGRKIAKCMKVFTPKVSRSVRYMKDVLNIRGIARILGKGVLDNACKILSHAHLLTSKIEVQIVSEHTF